MSEPSVGQYRPVQDGLRAAGFYLDRSGRRLVSLLVVADGIVLSLLSHDLRLADEGVLLTHDDLRDLFTQARAARGMAGSTPPPRRIDPLFPTGYEDFLRALGDAAARQNWPALRLLRVGDEAILRFGPAISRREMALKARDVEGILNRAFQQRGRGPLS